MTFKLLLLESQDDFLIALLLLENQSDSVITATTHVRDRKLQVLTWRQSFYNSRLLFNTSAISGNCDLS